MKKKNTNKNKVTRLKTTTQKSSSKNSSKKRLGMGLSSLLSSDSELTSAITNNSIKNNTNSEDKKLNKIADKIKLLNSESGGGNQTFTDGTQTKLPIHNLVSGKYQPRKNFDQAELEELADSIRVNGVLQPILVRPLSRNSKSYEIIAGERRWRASQLAKIHSVPVIVRNFDDETAMGVAMIENLQRSDLNIIEEAEGYRTMMNNFQFTQEKLSEQLGKSRSHIANVLRLLSLPKFVKRYVSSGELTFGHARSLVTLSEEDANNVANEVIDRDLSVRETERLVNKTKNIEPYPGKSLENPEKEKDPNILNLERDLTQLLGLKVEINHKNNNSGSLAILYKSIDQIQPIIDKLRWRPK
jgi:ParB family chromosome partitioning protein